MYIRWQQQLEAAAEQQRAKEAEDAYKEQKRREEEEDLANKREADATAAATAAAEEEQKRKEELELAKKQEEEAAEAAAALAKKALDHEARQQELETRVGEGTEPNLQVLAAPVGYETANKNKEPEKVLKDETQPTVISNGSNFCMALAGIRVRDEAEGLGEVVEELSKDDVMVLLGKESDKWLKVECSSGIQGWVLSANKRSTMVQKVRVSSNF